MTRVSTFDYKLPSMRKPDNFIAYHKRMAHTLFKAAAAYFTLTLSLPAL
jgi:hypothetical protein